MSGYPQKRGDGFDHYNNGRAQKHARADGPSQAQNGNRGSRQSSDNRRFSEGFQSRPPQHRPVTKRADEYALFDHIDRLPDPTKCEPCKLAATEADSGLIALLNKVEAEESWAKGDKDILCHARELRQLLSARNSKGQIERLDELDKERPAKDRPVLVPTYIAHKIELAKNLPPLPPIRELSLQEQVFTHISRKGDGKNGTVTSEMLTYEPLEFIGDAYLELFATRLIASRLPHISVPNQSTLREQLIKNDTLSKFSNAYCFPDRLKHAAHMKREGTSWHKVTADVFEAYIAGVVLSDPEHGFATAEQWMNQLWAQQMLEYKDPIVIDQASKDKLMRLIHAKGVTVEYCEEKPMEDNSGQGVQKYFLGVYLTGWGYRNEWLGSGEARNKQQAAICAAADALRRNNPALQSAIQQKQDVVNAEKVKRDENRELWRKQVAKGDLTSIVELKELISFDISIKKREANKGNEGAAAELLKLTAEEAQLSDRISQANGESPLPTAHIDGALEVQEDASKLTLSKVEKESKKKKKSNEDSGPNKEATKPTQESRKDGSWLKNGDWLEMIASGKADVKAATNPASNGESWLERERKKKEKKEKKEKKRRSP